MLALLHLDALSVPLLQRLMAEGRMPVLADLCRRGTWHDLDTPATHFPAASYASMYTGEAAGDHGLHFSLQWSAREQRLRYRLEFPEPRPVWDRLTEAGRTSFLVDPYELAPPSALAGRAVSGWQFANILSLERWALPEGWARPWERRLGRGPFMQEVFGRRSRRSLLHFRRAQAAAAGRVADLVVGALAQERCDFLCATFLGAHHAGHLFWDVSLLDTDERTRAEVEGSLAAIYEDTDRQVGRVLDALPGGADVVVVSPLGMGPDASRVDLLGEMLARVLSGGDGTGNGKADRIWRLRAALPTPARAAAARAMGARLAREMTCRLTMSGVNWAASPAFVVPSDEYGSIRLNLRGRERDGIVDPAEADELADRIAAGLLTFRDLDGGPAVAAVERSADVVPGRSAQLFPDLVVRWAETAGRVRGVRSERYGEVLRRGSGKGRTGGHDGQAFALVVPAGLRARAPSRRLHVTDVATTVCAALGLDDVPPGEALLG